MKHYSKPIVESIEVKSAGFIMGLKDASNPDHIMTTPKKRTKIF